MEYAEAKRRAREAGNPFVMDEMSEAEFMGGVIRGWYCWCGMEHLNPERLSTGHRLSTRYVDACPTRLVDE